MKNIIIPTNFESDTLSAVRTALTQTGYTNYRIVLLVISEVQETYSAASNLKNFRYLYRTQQENVLNKCRELVSAYNGVTLNVHYQYGISGPLLRNVMDHFNAGMVILTPSFKENKCRTNAHLLKLLLKSRYTLLHLSSIEIQTITNALYIEPKTTNFTLQELQQLINNKFNFRIVSRTKLSNELTLQDANPLIAEAISSKQIDMLVETRSPVQLAVKKGKPSRNLNFGVPVLSIYEEDIMN